MTRVFVIGPPDSISPNYGRCYDGPYCNATEIQITEPVVDVVAVYVHQCAYCGQYQSNRPQLPVSCRRCGARQGTRFVL